MRYQRQQSIALLGNENVPVRVGIIGVGNIGSHVALNLARVGVEVINLYDSDKVELHNIASQAYTEQDIGKHKVEAIRDEIKKINENTIVYTHKNATATKPLWVTENDYIVIAVDTMDTREKLSNILCAYGYTYPRKVRRVIDVRVGGEQIDVFNAERDAHQSTIRPDADIDPCGAQFIAYVSSIAGGLGSKEVIDSIISVNQSDRPLPLIKSYALDVRNMQIVNEI